MKPAHKRDAIPAGHGKRVHESDHRGPAARRQRNRHWHPKTDSRLLQKAAHGGALRLELGELGSSLCNHFRGCPSDVGFVAQLGLKRADLTLEVSQRLALLGALGLVVDQPLQRQDDLDFGQDRHGTISRPLDLGYDCHPTGRQETLQKRLALSQ